MISTNTAVVVEAVSPGVVEIRLNRPRVLNAINIELLDGLVDAIRQQSTTSRILIITGAGERSFCAGEDLKETLAPLNGSAAELRLAFNKLQDITRLTSSSSVIVIAAVQGFAIGGGAEIALAADFVIGGPGAKFRFPEVAIGHAVTGGITARLVQLVGLLRAKELLFTGRYVEAEEALKLGLLSELVDDPRKRAIELACELAELPEVSLRANKSSVERATFPHMESVLQDEASVASVCFAEDDAGKAFQNFARRKALENEPARRDTHAVRNINTAFADAVGQVPDRIFLRIGGSEKTFKEVDELVAQLAGGLRDIGICAGDRVLVMMRNSTEMVCSWLATNRLAATWVPVNTELRSITLTHVIESAKASVALVDEEFLHNVQSSGVVEPDRVYVNSTSVEKPLSSLYNTSSLITAAMAVPVSAATPAAFLYTSGTTGRSKPCILSHEYFILQASTLIRGCRLTAQDVLYCPFPLFHADATALTVIPAILLGCTAALALRFSASRFWEDIRQTKASVYDFMGATLALTYKQPPSPRDQDHSVRVAWGVPLHPSFSQDYQKRFGHDLVTLYGSVEASVPIFQLGDLEPGSCGRAVDGCEVRIASDEGDPLPVNAPGHLLLRSDQPNRFFSGYFNDPLSTLAAVLGGWLHTGDIAKIDRNGNVFFLGRSKDIIRRRGENINANEVEEEFLAHPDVVLVAAHGVPSALGEGAEEDLKVTVKLRDGSKLKEEELWMWATQKLARFQVPAVIEFVQDMKRTPTGKIEKHALNVEGGQRFDMRRMGAAAN
jgi:crotonobetaine/carnitine-CoA ligase